MQLRAIPADQPLHIMAGREAIGAQLLRETEQVGEFRPHVAADAGNRRAAARILADEIREYVVSEPVHEIEHVVRHSELLAHAARIARAVEGAAGPVGHIGAVIVQLHRHADDVAAALDEHRSGHRRVDAARHRDEDALALLRAVSGWE